MIDAFGRVIPDDMETAWSLAMRAHHRNNGGPLPYVVCGECGGLCCTACDGRGWLTHNDAYADARRRGTGPSMLPIATVRERFIAAQRAKHPMPSDPPDPTRTTLHAAGRAMGALMPAIGEAARSEGAKGGAIGCDLEAGRCIDCGGAAATPSAIRCDTCAAGHVRRARERAAHSMHILTCDEDGTERLDGAPTGRVLPVLSDERRAEVREMLRKLAPDTVATFDAESAERCPSLHCDRPIKRLESGVFWCPSCSWHGASLTPVVAPRFGAGDWTQAVGRPETVAQIVGLTLRGDVWWYDVIAEEHGRSWRHRRDTVPESDLEAAERPR